MVRVLSRWLGVVAVTLVIAQTAATARTCDTACCCDDDQTTCCCGCCH